MTAAAGVALMSHLSFGSQASAAKYQAKWFRLRERISSAATALGPAAIPEEAVVGLYESCARGPLLMTPWFGNTFADAAEQHLQAGFSSPKVGLGGGAGCLLPQPKPGHGACLPPLCSSCAPSCPAAGGPHLC